MRPGAVGCSFDRATSACARARAAGLEFRIAFAGAAIDVRERFIDRDRAGGDNALAARGIGFADAHQHFAIIQC